MQKRDEVRGIRLIMVHHTPLIDLLNNAWKFNLNNLDLCTNVIINDRGKKLNQINEPFMQNKSKYILICLFFFNIRSYHKLFPPSLNLLIVLPSDQ